MGDLRDWSPESNSGVLEDRLVVSSSSPSLLLSLNHTLIASECWQVAEEATRRIISRVQPTVVSEIRRKRVIDYVQRIIRGSLGCEVFPFGSVPLRTYLPDGDIDLTAFGGLTVEEALANDVFSILEREEQNRAAEFVVRDVQLIRAEVKLVKCLVQNIIVDISFNQLGGLCTLCFLEKVDGLIGKDHLFKRSIILIKAWCYYESRILGAHHGLISTYALETLVLYIFHFFNSSLNGPLGVLYTFLDYFSKFDWENYCISLNGPVRISSLPEIIVVTPETDGGDLLLSNEFVKECVEMFSVTSRGFETIPRSFPQKHLNIVDPLKETNNLGRSVTKGNFYRIRSAFTYGARKLGIILSRPEENIVDELHKFFSNTLDRHGNGQRPDVQDPIPHSICNGFSPALSSTGIDSFHENVAVLEPKSADLGSIHGECRLDHEESLCSGVENISGMEIRFNGTMNEQDSVKLLPSTMLSEPDSSASGTDISEYRLSGDAQDLAMSTRSGHIMITDDSHKFSSLNGEESMSPMGKAHHAPHLYFSPSSLGNGEMRNGSSDQLQPKDPDDTEKVFSRSLVAPAEETRVTACSHQDESEMVSNCEMLSLVGSHSDNTTRSSVASSSKDIYSGYPGYGAPTSIAESPDAVNSLSDLTGDYDSHLNSLQYGRWCFDYALGAIIPPMPPSLLSQIQSKNPWDAVRQSVQLKRNTFSQMNAHGVVSSPAFYSLNPPLIPGTPFGMEELPKPRGTGTYFPNVNHYNDRSFPARGRNQASVRSPRSNGRGWPSLEAPVSERSNRALPQNQFLVQQGLTKKSGYSESYQSSSPRKKVYSNANGSSHPSERVVEFGSIGSLSSGMTLDCSKQLNPGSAVTQNINVTLPTPEMQRPKPVLVNNQNRISLQSYHLKDEDDFPPLSG